MKKKVTNEPLAYHLRLTQVSELAATRGAGKRLPQRLVLPPGRYSVHGKTYDLRREGLYRFLLPASDNQQRIVFQRDPLAMVSAIAWIASHGNRHNSLKLEEAMAIAMRDKLIVTCGSIARFAVHVLTENGIPARVVNSKTLEKLNTYDSGHVLLEAWLEGRWTLVDPDLKVMFHRKGRRLSLLEFAEASQSGDYTLERLAAAAGLAVGCFVEQGYDYSLYMETALCDEEHMRRWYRRIMMLPIIRDGDDWYITGEPEVAQKASRLYDRKFVFLDRHAFQRRFYRPPTAAGG